MDCQERCQDREPANQDDPQGDGCDSPEARIIVELKLYWERYRGGRERRRR